MKKRRLKKPAGQADQWGVPEKRMRGQGVFYAEAKSATAKLSLTPTAKMRLEQLAALNNLSMSEFVERWLMGKSDLQLP